MERLGEIEDKDSGRSVSAVAPAYHALDQTRIYFSYLRYYRHALARAKYTMRMLDGVQMITRSGKHRENLATNQKELVSFVVLACHVADRSSL